MPLDTHQTPECGNCGRLTYRLPHYYICINCGHREMHTPAKRSTPKPPPIVPQPKPFTVTNHPKPNPVSLHVEGSADSDYVPLGPEWEAEVMKNRTPMWWCGPHNQPTPNRNENDRRTD